MPPSNQRIKYYHDFFNNNFLREFRIATTYIHREFIKKNNIIGKTLHYRVLKHDNGHSNVYSEIYGFKNWEEFEKNKHIIKSKKKVFSCDRPSRIHDRLYFDFDFNNKKAKILKNDIENAIKKKRFC